MAGGNIRPNQSYFIVLSLVLLYFPDFSQQCRKSPIPPSQTTLLPLPNVTWSEKWAERQQFMWDLCIGDLEFLCDPAVKPSTLLLDNKLQGYQFLPARQIPLEVLPVPNSFRDEDGQNPTVITLPNAPGCFIFTGSEFDLQKASADFVAFKEDEYAEKTDILTVDKCVKKCAEQRIFTYAGLQDGMNVANCHCFNYLDLLTPSTCSGCMFYTGNTSSGNPSIAVRRRCSTDNIYRIYVQATCPYSFYTPPLCLDRAKDTCATVKEGMPLTTHYGKCTKCDLSNAFSYLSDPVFHFDILDYCDVLQDELFIEDFKVWEMSVNPTSTYYQDGRKYTTQATSDIEFWGLAIINNTKEFFKYDTSNEQDIISNTPLGMDSKYGNGINIITKNKPDLPVNQLFTDTSRRIYLKDVQAGINAAGAFFLSLWEDLGPKYYLSTDWGKSIPSFIKDIGEAKANSLRWVWYLQNSWTRFYKLQYKQLIDRDLTEAYWIRDIFMLLQPTEFRKNLKLGWHTLDTKATWGGTGSMEEAVKYQSLACHTIYLYESNHQDTLTTFTVANMKNSWKRDKIPDGWNPGEVAVATVSHDLVNNPNPDWSADYNKRFQYENVIGVKAQYPYHQDCRLKPIFVIACPDNCIKQQCNTNGDCAHGCVTGYFGIRCDMKCPIGKYSQNCASDCPITCLLKACDRFSGLCTGWCAPGYSGPHCVPCKAGYYGGQCASACSRTCSKLDTTGLGVCDAATGVCDGGCVVGYQPPLCVLPCQNNTYGIRCEQKCGTCKGNECHPVTGYCKAGCATNYMPPNCKCLGGTWGPTCTNTCGACRNSLPCNPDTGICDGGGPIDPSNMCTNNTQPPRCICTRGKWGADCDKVCGNCDRGFCMDDTGKCLLGCSPGFQGDLCNKNCTTGTWGRGCSGQCGMCNRSSSCNPADGKCASGCSRGYKAPTCATCAYGFWGEDCSKQCGHCRAGGICDVNGTCPYVPLPPSLLPSGRNIFEGVTTLQQAVDVAQSKAGLADIDTLIVAVKYLCEPGFQPLTCICKTGYYGDLCTKPCANCFIGCTDSGTCLGGCIPGFYGINCSKPCPNGFFGPNCNFNCGNCFNNTGCTADTGICKKGCDPGYMLPYCKCAFGYFGDKCEHRCGHCVAGTTCSFYSGKCESGCQGDWREPYCNCTKGRYRLDCSGKCGNCFEGKDCDVETGECKSGCNPGYSSPFCSKICEPGKFGFGCVVDCGHCRDCQTCDQTTGNCPAGCDDGYLPPQCTQTCSPGRFGRSCQSKCGFCYNSTVCNSIDGFCDKGCDTGYLSPYCAQACPANTWGFNCQNACGNCKNGSTCNYLDGKCAGGCMYSSLKEPYCILTLNAINAGSVCPSGFYIPPSCNTPCGHCLANIPCNGLLGFCVTGCMPGYKPLLCIEPCDAGTYGANCLEICGKCSGTGGCRKIDGVCVSGCKAGWYGDTCKYTSQSEAGAVKNIVSRHRTSFELTTLHLVFVFMVCHARL